MKTEMESETIQWKMWRQGLGSELCHAVVTLHKTSEHFVKLHCIRTRKEMLWKEVRMSSISSCHWKEAQELPLNSTADGLYTDTPLEEQERQEPEYAKKIEMNDKTDFQTAYGRPLHL